MFRSVIVSAMLAVSRVEIISRTVANGARLDRWRTNAEITGSKRGEAVLWHWQCNKPEPRPGMPFDLSYDVKLMKWTGWVANYARRLLNRYCKDYRANVPAMEQALDDVISEAQYLYHTGYPVQIAVFMAARRQMRRDGKLKLATDTAGGDKNTDKSVTDILDNNKSAARIDPAQTFVDCGLDFGNLFAALEIEREETKMQKSRRRGRLSAYLYANDEKTIVRKPSGGKAKVRSKKKSAGSIGTRGINFTGYAMNRQATRQIFDTIIDGKREPEKHIAPENFVSELVPYDYTDELTVRQKSAIKNGHMLLEVSPVKHDGTCKHKIDPDHCHHCKVEREPVVYG